MASQRITEISVTPIPAYFPHEIGRNSFNWGHGTTELEWLVRARTEGGLEGIVNAMQHLWEAGEGSVESLIQLLKEVVLGRRIDDFLEVSGNRVVGPKKEANRIFRSHRWMSILAYDLMGREMGVSCVELLGGKKRDRVDAYDTTLYFGDLRIPEKGAAQVVEEASEALEAGWRQLKLKMGRGKRWMAPEAGMRRDVEVVQAVREAAGPDVTILVDANFGYDGRLDLLEDFMRETLPANIFWLEEMVRADVDAYRAIRKIQEKLGSQSLLVCGEVDGTYPISYVYLDLAEDGLIDGYQPDIVSHGYTRWKEIERLLEGTGVRCVPHCFHNGNFGTRASLIWGAASESFISIEDERTAPNVYRQDAFTFENGSYAVADAPGLGLEVDEDVFQRRYASNEIKISI